MDQSRVHKQDEFVVGGWTEPKGARNYFGSLILGRYDESGNLVHAGDVGTGFNGAELQRLWKLLQPLATDSSAFHIPPKTLGRPRWVKPKLVAQVRYTEMTDDGRLRHPAYLGLRDDKVASEVKADYRPKIAPKTGIVTKPKTNDKEPTRRSTKASNARNPLKAWAAHAESLTAQLDDLEKRKKDGKLRLPDGDTLDVTNLQKIFWPGPKYTKGDLIRYYARMAPLILPVINERPLVMKRFPNGVDDQAFYQHRAPTFSPGRACRANRGHRRADHVRWRVVEDAALHGAAGVDLNGHLVLYSHRLGRGGRRRNHFDPQPGATFSQILDVARWVRRRGARALEGARLSEDVWRRGPACLHPAPHGNLLRDGRVVLSDVTANDRRLETSQGGDRRAHGEATQRRNRLCVFLQNIPGKTLACAYSARASAFAGVSAPLTWDEIDDEISPKDFTIKTIEARVNEVGDLWEKSHGLRSAPTSRWRSRS